MSAREFSNRLVGAVFGVLLLASTFAAGEARGQAAVTYDLNSQRYGGEFMIPLNKSLILRIGTPFADLRVGNPEIADVLPLTNQNIYILGKSPGSTSLSILAPSRDPIAIIDLLVTYDVEGIKRRIFDLLPDEAIEVRGAGDAVILSGSASSATAASSAATIADRFAPGKVTNLIQVTGSQQVMLAVRFAEMQRSLVKEMGIETNLFYNGNDASLGLTSGGILTGAFGTIGLTDLSIGDVSFDLFLDALEQKGVVKTLAEPNLIALSGETATFLAGGSIPITTAVTSTTGEPGAQPVVSTIYKDFGVELEFTPTVLGDGIINLHVAPSVSNTVPSASGGSNPAFNVRKAETTVELRDGQSFAIAGLLQSEFSDSVSQFPFLGDLPIIGALFRSSGFIKGETELVIVITPHLVKPARGPDKLALPTDNFVPPSELSLFLFGRTEGWSSGRPQKTPRDDEEGGAIISSRPPGGLDGSYGHIIQ